MHERLVTEFETAWSTNLVLVRYLILISGASIEDTARFVLGGIDNGRNYKRSVCNIEQPPIWHHLQMEVTALYKVSVM